MTGSDRDVDGSGDRRTRRIVRRGARTAGSAVLLAVALLVVVVSIAAASGSRLLVIRSGSMGRTAPVGSLVITRTIPADRVGRGTIVAIPAKDGTTAPTLHRVIHVRHDAHGIVVRTKGDANTAVDPDPHVLAGAVLTPAYVIPALGYVVSASRSPLGWVVIILGPGTLLFGLLLRAIWSRPTAKAEDESGMSTELNAELERHVGEVLRAAERAAHLIEASAHERAAVVRAAADAEMRGARERASELLTVVDRWIACNDLDPATAPAPARAIEPSPEVAAWASRLAAD